MANELLTRKDKVVVVTSNEKISVRCYKTQVGDVMERHSTYVEKSDL